MKCLATNSTTSTTEDEAFGTGLVLKIADAEGLPIRFAIVSTNAATYTTDVAGHVFLNDLPAGRFVGHVEAEGFTSASVVVQLPKGAQTGQEIRLLRAGSMIAFHADEGGVVDGPNGVRITIPPNALVNETGAWVHGLVSITISPLDPTKHLAMAPAPLIGVSGVNDSHVGLDALFLADVSLWQNGHRLQLAAGKTAAIEYVLPEEIAATHAAGDQVPAWWLDINAGVWRKDVEGVINPSMIQSGRLSWFARVPHFTWWGSLEPWTDKNCFRVKVVNTKGKAQANVQLSGIGTSYMGYSAPAVTNALGEACVDIKRGGTANIYAGSVYETLVPPISVTGVGPASACEGLGAPCAMATIVVPPGRCVPGSIQACVYTGPAGTENVGPCHRGSQLCSPYGTAWSLCYGEVTPKPETCATTADDDCNGIVPPLDDNNPCTADSCNGTTGLIMHAPLPLGTSCSGAGMICNGAGQCGNCTVGTDCPGVDDACKTRICTSGLCGFAHAPMGTACDDDNPCTMNEICATGICGGADAVVCPASNLCNLGTCDPMIGCTTVPKANGTACNDFSDCTQADACQSGVCVGSIGCSLGTTCISNTCVTGACPGTVGLSVRPQWTMAPNGPRATAMADFDLDGYLDFATATSPNEFGPWYLSVALGQSGGTFDSLNIYSGIETSLLVAADLNGDLKPDLIGGGPYINIPLRLMTNQGNGTFATTAIFSSTGVFAIAAADMTGDGRMDILASRGVQPSGTEIAVYANQGNGNFIYSSTVNTGNIYAMRVRAADVNGDGKLDVVFTRGGNNTMGISYQQAGGTFSVPYDYVVNSYEGEIGAADFNGDGKLDLAITTSSGVNVFMNQGNGVLAQSYYWAPALSPSYGASIGGIETADIDGDGDVDILLTKLDGLLQVFKNQGNGTFVATGQYSVGDSPRVPKARDMNNDGLLDVIVENSFAGTMTVALNRGNGVFENRETRYPAGVYPTMVAVADLNADGKPDIAVPNSSTTTVSVLLNDGMGGVLPAVAQSVGTQPVGITLSDVDGNGQPDIVTANSGSNNISVRLNQGNATFAAVVNYGVGSNPVSVAAAQLTADGQLDLAVVNKASNTVSVLLNQGNGSFGTATHYLAGSSPVWVAAGDMNGDGKADLAIANDLNMEVNVLLNQGNGSFAPSIGYWSGTNPAAVAVGDLNGDSRADIAVANKGSRDVSVLLNQGNGSFTVAPSYVIRAIGASNLVSIALADMNGDGHLDIVVADQYTNNAIVLLNQGNGAFAPGDHYPIGFEPIGIVPADMNGDGRPDIVMASYTTHSVDVFFNKCLP